MQEIKIIEPGLQVILQRDPTALENSWPHLPAFRIGDVASVADEMVEEQTITAIVLFPDLQVQAEMIWGYKLGHEGNIFYPEDSLIVIAS